MSVKTVGRWAALVAAFPGLLMLSVLVAGCGGGEASSAPAAKATLSGLRVEMHHDPG